jgi:hypothetical protein
MSYERIRGRRVSVELTRSQRLTYFVSHALQGSRCMYVSSFKVELALDQQPLQFQVVEMFDISVKPDLRKMFVNGLDA